MNVRSIPRWSMVCVAMLVMASCISNHAATVVDTPPIDWCESVELAFENRDSVSRVNVNVVVYYASEAPDSAALVVQTTSPDGYRALDTLMCYLPKNKQQDYCHREIPYRCATTLRCKGTYQLKFTPLDTLDGVWAVGLNTITAN